MFTSLYLRIKRSRAYNRDMEALDRLLDAEVITETQHIIVARQMKVWAKR